MPLDFRVIRRSLTVRRLSRGSARVVVHSEEMPLSLEQNDWLLVAQVTAGDERAFNLLMERYKRPVLSFVYRMIGDAAEAEDVAQDVFVRAYRSMRAARVRPTTGLFSTWLFQVACNAALDCLRRRKRHPAESLAPLGEPGRTVAAAGQSASEEAVARETGQAIARAIALLPEDQRTAVILAEYEGFSIETIGAILKCSRKSVEGRLYRARQFLRSHLAPLLR